MPKTPLVAVDCVIFDKKAPLLITRKNEPFKSQYALPGGFVETGETVERACMREVLEETNLKLSGLKMVGIYSDPKRDPRGHVISVAFLGKTKSRNLKAGDDAADAEFVSSWQKAPIAFDHKKIINDAVKLRLKW